MVGRKTEKTRFRRGMQKIKTLMRENMHRPIKEQIRRINQFLRGNYNYYGLGGNFCMLSKIYHNAERIWRKMLGKRSRKSFVSWEKFSKIKELYSILKPSLKIPYVKMKELATL